MTEAEDDKAWLAYFVRPYDSPAIVFPEKAELDAYLVGLKHDQDLRKEKFAQLPQSDQDAQVTSTL